MKICRKGFSLFHFVVYLAIFSILVSLTMQWACTVINIVRRSGVVGREKISATMVHDLLLRDLRQARQESDQWLHISDTQLVWQGHNGHIGWDHQKDMIIRITGDYEQHKASWKNAQKAVIATGVEKLLFIVNRSDQKIISVIYTVSFRTCDVTGLVAPRILDIYEPV
jgi:hypothetical protein